MIIKTLASPLSTPAMIRREWDDVGGWGNIDNTLFMSKVLELLLKLQHCDILEIGFKKLQKNEQKWRCVKIIMFYEIRFFNRSVLQFQNQICIYTRIGVYFLTRTPLFWNMLWPILSILCWAEPTRSRKVHFMRVGGRNLRTLAINNRLKFIVKAHRPWLLYFPWLSRPSYETERLR